MKRKFRRSWSQQLKQWFNRSKLDQQSMSPKNLSYDSVGISHCGYWAVVCVVVLQDFSEGMILSIRCKPTLLLPFYLTGTTQDRMHFSYQHGKLIPILLNHWWNTKDMRSTLIKNLFYRNSIWYLHNKIAFGLKNNSTV